VRVRLEAHLGAAPVERPPDLLQLALRLAALEYLRVQALSARDPTSSRSDNALTTDTPTPCKPPEVS
jgi:hypothetical protein